MEISTFPLTAGRRYSAAKLEIIMELGSGGRVGGREAMSGYRPQGCIRAPSFYEYLWGTLPTVCWALFQVPGTQDRTDIVPTLRKPIS